MSTSHIKLKPIFWFSAIAAMTVYSVASAAEKAKTPPAPAQQAVAPGSPADTSGAEEVQIEKIKQKYWAGGDEAQVGVVQNRAFSKAGKWSLGVQTGFLFNDPFLDNKAVAPVIGYHFSEYFAVEVMYWKIWASASSAGDKLGSPPNPKTANTNPPNAFYGAEALWSIMYGKLSLVGKAIIYYDMHFIAGGGITKTETGNNMTGIVGLGQRFYLGHSTSLRFDYRFVAYNENIVEKEITNKLGQSDGTRWNLGHSLFLGFDFMFGGGGK